VGPIELSGKAGQISGACPAITFEIKDRTVYTTLLTVYTKTSCDRIDKGTDLKVNGMEMSDGRVRADEVTRK
jgi:hypothetical protein